MAPLTPEIDPMLVDLVLVILGESLSLAGLKALNLPNTYLEFTNLIVLPIGPRLALELIRPLDFCDRALMEVRAHHH